MCSPERRHTLTVSALRPNCLAALSASRAWIRVNGEPKPLPAGATVGSLLESLVLRRNGVAVALNDEVVTRGAWDTTPLTNEDRVEILHAVGGG